MHGARGLEFLLLIECGQLKAPQFSEMQLVCLKNRAGLSSIKHRGCGPESWKPRVWPQFCFSDLHVMCFGMDLSQFVFRSRTLLLERKLPGCPLAQAGLRKGRVISRDSFSLRWREGRALQGQQAPWGRRPLGTRSLSFL